MALNILSIDVGMKNLAICLFSITDNIEYKIKCCDVLNLCEEQNFVCGEKNKKGQPCNKNAKFFKNDKYYCKIHAKKKEYKIPPQELNPNKFKKRYLFFEKYFGSITKFAIIIASINFFGPLSRGYGNRRINETKIC